MRFYLSIIIIIVWRISSLSQEIESHYFYEDRPLPLKLELDKISLRFDARFNVQQSEQLLRRVLGIHYRDSEPLFRSDQRLVNLNRSMTESEVVNLIQDLLREKEVKMAAPVYLYKQTCVAVTDEFMVRFNSFATRTEIEAFNLIYKAQIKFSLAEDTYVLAVDKSSGLNGLSAANLYHDSELTAWASPNFVYRPGQLLNATVNDPYWSEQWAHRNTGQLVATGAAEGNPSHVNGQVDADMDVDLAWDALIAAGKTAGGSADILVAIIDSGMDLDHPDLAGNIPNPGHDFTSDGTTDDLQGHGTAVSGIVAALGNNGQGVAGIAYQSKLLPVKFYSMWASAPDDAIAQAIDYAWQNGADILNNSWGGSAPNQGVTDAIHRAKTQGRNGLGCVILFSSGNEGNGEVNYPAYLEDVIAVGASNMYDEKKNPGSQDYLRKWGGNYGSALDLVAPTTVYTTDVLGPTGGGLPGFKDGDYNDSFSGTSAACPNATGVAALILAANPNLTNDQVQQILQSSADKIELYPYNSNGWNQHVGYGRVNVHKAVLKALGEDGEAPKISLTPLQETTTIGSRQISAEISDESGLASGASQPRLYYRTIFEGDTSTWTYVLDQDGPAGSNYEFTIPAVSWGNQVQYYIAAQDNSDLNTMCTFPFGGSGINPPGTTAPSKVLRYFVGEFNSQTYTSTNVPISWTNYQGHTSTLNISDHHTIVDLNTTIDVSGYIEDFAIDLEGPDNFGSGIAMLNPGTAYDNTTFDDEAATQITDGSSPYTGTYIPDNSLVTFDGKNTTGQWTLRVYDDLYYNNGGTIHGWNVEVKYMLPVNPPLVSNIPDQTIQEGGSFSQINLDNYVTDADNSDQEMTWTASGQTDLIVNINQSTRLATISTPDQDWFGQESITFTASDPTLLKDGDDVLFIVTNINDPPIVDNIPDQQINEGDTFAQINLNNYVHDIDNSDAEISWSATGNSELSVSINPQTKIATIGIPHVDWNGGESITFEAKDPAQLSDNDLAAFTVMAVNDAPQVSEIPDQTILEEQQFASISLDNYVSDVDNADSEMTWTYQGNEELIVTINQHRIVTVSLPYALWTGSEVITFKATDPAQLSDSTATMFTVTAVNDPPIVTGIPDQIILEGDQFESIILDNYVSDEDNADAELTWIYSGNIELIVSIDANRIAHIAAPNEYWFGSETIVFKASDPAGLFDTDTARFIITPVNGAPVVSDIPNQTINEGGTFIPIDLDNYVNDYDNSPEEMIWAYTGNQELIVSIDNQRVATITLPDPQWTGQEQITFIATDPDGLSDNDVAVFTVGNINDPPVITNIPDQTILEGQQFAPIILDNYVSDEDNSDSEIIWTYSGNVELMISIDANRVATISIPDPQWTGQEQVLFKATDPGGLQDSDSATFKVEAVNDAPQIIAALPMITFNEDDSLLFPFSNWYAYVEDVDDADDKLLYLVIDEQNTVKAKSQQNAYLFKAPLNWFGSDTLLLQVMDQFYSVSDFFEVRIRSINDAPQIINLPDSIIFENKDTYPVDLSEFEYDVDTHREDLGWTILTGDSALKVNYNSLTKMAELSAPDFIGMSHLFLTLSDDSSATALDTIAVRVKGSTEIESPLGSLLPAHYVLDQNYPNPFNPSTTIRYALPVMSSVELSLYTLHGQKIMVLVDALQRPGYHEIKLEMADFSSGVYFYRLEASATEGQTGFVQIRKMILMR